MKLAPALSRRKALTDEIAKLKDEISSKLRDFSKDNKEKNSEDDVRNMLKKYDAKMEEYGRLIAKINQVNEDSIIDNQRLADLLVRRTVISKAAERAKRFAESAVVTRGTTATEIRMVPSIRSFELYKHYESYRKTLCDLEIKIQAANWTIKIDVDEPAKEATELLAHS